MPAHVLPCPGLAMLRAALLAVALVAAWILLQTTHRIPAPGAVLIARASRHATSYPQS